MGIASKFQFAAVAAILSLPSMFAGSAANAVIAFPHELEVGLVGYGGYKVYRSVVSSGKLSAEMNFELEKAARALTDLDRSVADLNSRAQLVEVGEPRINQRTVYTGRFLDASTYKADAASHQARSNNSYRLQPDGAAKLAKVIADETSGREGMIRMTIDRVNGTQDGSIQMAESIRVEGDAATVTQKLVEATRAQDPNLAMKSIVRVTVEFDLPKVPDAARAAGIRAEAEKIATGRPAAEAQVQSDKAVIREKFRVKGAAIKKSLRVHVGVIVGAISLLWVRDSFAHGMITMAHACQDEAALRTHATGWALQTGRDFDEVYRKAQELCAK